MTTMRRQWCWSWWQGHSGGDCKCVEHVFGEAVDTPPRRDQTIAGVSTAPQQVNTSGSVCCDASRVATSTNTQFNHIVHPVHGCVLWSHRTLCHLVCFVHVAMSVGFVHTCMLKVCNACTHSEHKLKCELVQLMLLAAGTGTLQRTTRNMFSFNSSELENIAVLPHDC